MFDVHLCVAFLARLGSRVGDHVRSNLLCAQKMNATAQQNQKGDLMDLVISGLGWSDFSPSSSGLMFRCFPLPAYNLSLALGNRVSIRGDHPATLTVSAPLGTLKLARSPPLLPFEDTSRKGGHSAKVQRKPKHHTKKRVWTPAHKRVSKKAQRGGW